MANRENCTFLLLRNPLPPALSPFPKMFHFAGTKRRQKPISFPIKWISLKKKLTSRKNPPQLKSRPRKNSFPKSYTQEAKLAKIPFGFVSKATGTPIVRSQWKITTGFREFLKRLQALDIVSLVFRT